MNEALKIQNEIGYIEHGIIEINFPYSFDYYKFKSEKI